MELLRKKTGRLRCVLCRNGLLRGYEVYSREAGAFGVPGVPVLYAFTFGYFFMKNKRRFADILEMAGNIPARSSHDHMLLAFDENAAKDDLILADGEFFRVSFIREIGSGCRILELEVEPVEASH